MFGLANKRRFQFGLRSLLLFTLVVAVPAAWYGNQLRARQRQEQAYTEILAKGGSVYISLGVPRVGFIHNLLCPTSPLEDSVGQRWVGYIRYYLYLPSLDDSRHLFGYVQPQFSDADLRLLGPIRNLAGVNFDRSQVSVAAAREFQRTHPGCYVSHPDFLETKNNDSSQSIDSIPEMPKPDTPTPSPDSFPEPKDN